MRWVGVAQRMHSRWVNLAHVLLLFLLATAATAEDPTPTPTPTLLFVAELCRHGDRTPLAEFPSDVLPASKWPEGVGQLTAIGQRAHYNLGKRLRAELVDTNFLPQTFSPSDVHARSSGIDRAAMSAVAQLAGLYPPGTASREDVRVRFGQDALGEDEGGLPHAYQPIPLHSDLVATEALLLPGGNCPRQDVIYARKRKRPAYREAHEKARDPLRAMARAAGVKDVESFTLRDAMLVHDTWLCAQAHAVPLPDGATSALLEFGRNATRWVNLFDNDSAELRRLRAGVLLNTVREYMALAARRYRRTLKRDAGEEALVRKFVLLSAHDSTVAAALAALRVFDGWAPAYNSTVMWRLVAFADGMLGVRVEYNGRVMRVPGCADMTCGVDEYVRATKDVTVNGEAERAAECETGWRRVATSVGAVFVREKEADVSDEFGLQPGRAAHANSSGLVLLAVATVVAVVLTIAAVTRFVLRRKDYMRAPSDDLDDGERQLDESSLNRRILL